jgi:DNA-directed RNA polymerase specialized sigma24 family protein
MPISDDIMKRARRSDRRAIEAILADSYPAMHRMAYALTGDPKLAQRVVRLVLRRAVRLMPRWRKGITPENWFYHQMLLSAREASSKVSPDRDVLITAGPTGQPAYVAFICALRGLPQQQMEAFVLNHGEQLNPRLLGVAMDCSTIAASTHLAAGMQALQGIAIDSFPALVSTFERAYHTLTPPQTIVRSATTQQTGSVIWQIRLRRLIRRMVWLVVLASIGYAVWRWHPILLHWFEAVRSAAQTQKT